MRSFYGVTLVELVVSVATVCILSATVVPAFTSIIRSNEIHTTISKLRQGLYFARQSALLEDGTVVICKSATGSDCTGSGDWNQGWLIFQDRNDDGQCVDANDDDQCDEDEGRLLRVAAASALHPTDSSATAISQIVSNSTTWADHPDTMGQPACAKTTICHRCEALSSQIRAAFVSPAIRVSSIVAAVNLGGSRRSERRLEANPWATKTPLSPPGPSYAPAPLPPTAAADL